MIGRILAACAVLLLSAPSALGVQRALAPTRGDVAGWLAAVGIEATYLATVLLSVNADLERRARRVALVAVIAAIALNALADYAARVSGGLSSSATFLATFDALHLALSVIESASLSGLAYALALLAHRVNASQMSHVIRDMSQPMSQPASLVTSDVTSDAQSVTRVTTDMSQPASLVTSDVTSDAQSVTRVTTDMAQPVSRDMLRDMARDIAAERGVSLRHAYRIARQLCHASDAQGHTTPVTPQSRNGNVLGT